MLGIGGTIVVGDDIGRFKDNDDDKDPNKNKDFGLKEKPPKEKPTIDEEEEDI